MTELEWALSIMEAEYGKTIAKRSRQPYMKHILDGVKILQYMGTEYNAICAFAVHPLFQIDHLLIKNWNRIVELRPSTIMYAMHYRETANSYLRKDYTSRSDTMPHIILPAVRDMLIADKVQNWSDCLRFQSNEEVCRLYVYFINWLNHLGINDWKFEELAGIMENQTRYKNDPREWPILWDMKDE